MSSSQSFRSFARLGDERFQSRDLGLGGDEVAHVRGELFGRELVSGLLGAKHGVAEPLREPVDGLPGAIQLEPHPTFVERA